jgi:hypothetical protein
VKASLRHTVLEVGDKARYDGGTGERIEERGQQKGGGN